ncbi:conserved protein of unknown function [Rhodovastum atsumiense]|uniref:Uncharacterized protein n=1 Tax=Rhodovastum atsumiense TaxID=504468 RepID=A0A5M6IYQ8_9PROT|nr:hypothetical protein [Rhodovastum atsumiense]KAA5613476.1 hypothetical protein F1189_05315 [Rhodovastum atsumiense]CAH2603217.1 conserved protein of unknown function [Rhodovastum atsumiense]
MADTYLTLGGMSFIDDFTVPEAINGGGTHHVVLHRFIGGARVIDALGPDDDAIRWRGRFRGADASFRVAMLDVMRRSGRPVILSYWTFRYRVVVTRFVWRFERFYEIAYAIECTVVQDLKARAWTAVASGLDSLFGADLSLAEMLGVGAAAVNDALAAVLMAQAAAGSLGTATRSGLGGVLSAVTMAVSVAATASMAAETMAGSVGGVEAGGDPQAMGAGLVASGNAFQEAAAGVQAGGVFSRMRANLEAGG